MTSHTKRRLSDDKIITQPHIPCPCGKSSDAFCVYKDGHGYCFSCNTFKQPVKPEKELGFDLNLNLDSATDEIEYTLKPQRGISKEVFEFYDAYTKVKNGVDHSIGFVWPNSAVKLRLLGDDIPKRSRFTWRKTEEGDVGKGLFGMDKFPKGSYKTLTITEGPTDSLAIFEATNKRTAAVGVDSSSTAVRDVRDCFDYVNSFDKIILAFDPDDAGQRAVKGVLSLFQDQTKVFVMDFEEGMDCNDYVMQGRSEDLRGLWVHAKKITNSDFIHTFSEVTESLVESRHDIVGSYPLKKLQMALRGAVRGELVVWKGLEGIGKTELFRVLEYHMLKNPVEDADGNIRKPKIAVIHMEEDKSVTIRGLATHESGIPMFFEEDGIEHGEITKAYEKAVGGEEDRFFIYKIRGSEDPRDVLTSIRTLVVTSGVDIVFIDNLNKMVDSLEEDRERQLLVFLAAKLKDLAEDLHISVQLISHVNDDGKSLGSRYTTKVADKVIHMERDKENSDPVEAMKLHLTIEKGRMARGSGYVGYLEWDSVGYKLKPPAGENYE